MKELNVAEYNLPWEHQHPLPEFSIHDDTFLHYLRTIICMVPGVTGVFTYSFFGSHAYLSDKKRLRKAIVITETQEGLKLLVSIQVRAGLPLREIAYLVQQKTQETLAEKWNKKVASITVKIEKIMLH